MKIKIQDGAVNLDQLKTKLENHFAGKYTVSTRNKTLVVAQNKTYGAIVVPTKKSIIVNGNFATMGGQLTFTLLLILLGIILPLIIYFAVFHKKMKAVEKEVGAYIQELYKDKLV